MPMEYVWKISIVIILIVIITFSLGPSSNTFSIREILGLSPPQTEQTQPTAAEVPDKKNKQPSNTQEPENTSPQLDFSEIQRVISVVDENQRKILLADEEAFRNFVQNEATNKSVLFAAHVNKIDQDDRNLFIARRGAENILREIYLKKLIASKIPPDFPTEQQTRDFYEQNKDKFTVEDRVHVWQIFLATPENMDEKEVELLKKKAETIVTDLNKGKIDFDAAAKKYSEQIASKYAGGYMGLIKVSELKPGIKDPLLALEPGKISLPIKTEDGIHILKRGNIVPQQVLDYDEVKTQIAQSLNNQVQNQMRQTIYKQASETYPVDLQDKTIEEWRLKLRTNIAPSESADNP